MEKYMLYEALCRLVREELSILRKVDINSAYIKIEDVKLSKNEFDTLLCEFERIVSSSYKEYFSQVNPNIIPVKLEGLPRFKSIQLLLKKIRG